MSFQMWPHLVEIMRHLLNGDSIVVLKARQIGLSWLVAAYALWMAITKDSANILMFSKGEKECWALLDKCKQMWMHLPPFLKVPLYKDSAEELAFKHIKDPNNKDDYTLSHIKAFASTVSAGIGEAASVVIADEWEYHPFAKDNYRHVIPTIESSGGQFVGCFTVDKKNPDTFAKQMFKMAYFDNTSEFVGLFYPYTVRPGRDEEWYHKKLLNLPADELDGLSPELHMQQNYPRSVEEALSAVQSIAAFDLNILDDMKKDCRPPLDLREKYPELNHQYCHIYKDFQPGKTYVATTDSAAGVGKDYYVSIVMDVRTWEVVADFMSNTMPVEDSTYQTVQLLKVFHNPKWFPEDNNQGVDTIRCAINLNYKNFGYYDDKKKKIGFHSNDSNRTLIWGGLQSAINNRQLVIYNKDGLQQFYDIYWNTNHQPSRLEAMTGRHDDYCTAVAIALWACEKVPLGTQTFEPVQTLTFGNTQDIWWDDEPISTLSFRR